MNPNDGNTTPPPSHGGVRHPNTITPPPSNITDTTQQPNIPVTPPPIRPNEVRASTTVTPPRRPPPTPPPTTPVATRSPGPSGSGGKRPMTPRSKSESPRNKSAICSICGKNMWHEKALNGHIRWHTQEERDAANRAVQENVLVIRDVASPAGDVATRVENVEEETGSSLKRVRVIPDLNQSPPQDEE